MATQQLQSRIGKHYELTHTLMTRDGWPEGTVMGEDGLPVAPDYHDKMMI